MRLVIVESPYASSDLAVVTANEDYARRCLADCLRRGEAPFASHLLYTQPNVLDDSIEDERRLGIIAGLFWGSKADATVVYQDRGISVGMRLGIQHARDAGRPVEYRTLGRGSTIL